MSQASYQYENRLLCMFAHIDVANNASARGFSNAKIDCYKDIKVKFTEWSQKSKLIIRIITFLLGFYVSTIFKQYRSKINTIPDAENPVLEIGGLANERTEDAFKGELVSPVGVTEWKRTMARYCLLSWTMCFNTISQPLASKLGTGDQLVEKGLITKEELTALVVSFKLLFPPRSETNPVFLFFRVPTPRMKTWPASHLICGL